MFILLLLPIVGHWCFLFDGVYIGLTLGRVMRNSMFVSAILVFFPIWWVFEESGNLALWIAFLAFLAARGLTLGGHFIFVYLNSPARAYEKAD